MIDFHAVITCCLCLAILKNIFDIVKLRRDIEEQRNYVLGLVTANILEGLKVSDKELKEKIAEITDVEE